MGQEKKNISEINREFDAERRYRELFAAEEVKKTREIPVKEHASPPQRKRSKAKRSVSVVAATALTAVVTVAAVVSLALSVKLISFVADYTELQFVLDIENADDKPLTALLSQRGERIGESEITAGKNVSLAFTDLAMGAEYLLEIVAGSGETIFSQTFATRSPVTFFEKPQEPDKLYFTIDDGVFTDYPEIAATLVSSGGLDLMAIEYTENGEGYIDKGALFAGTYYFSLQGFSDASADYPDHLFDTELEFGGPQAPVFEFFETDEGIGFRMTEGETGPYELRYAALESNGSYEQFELAGGADTQLIPTGLLPAGIYTVYIIGERQTGGTTVAVPVYMHTIILNGPSVTA